MSVGVNH